MRMLRESLKGRKMEELLISAGGFKPFPTIEDRTFWLGLAGELKQHLVEKGEGYLGFGWPGPLATHSLAFVRPEGDRAEFEKLSFERRMALGSLVIAECVENQGRFTDDIINGIWVICEESSWCSCAHLNMGKRPSDGLPDVVNEALVDLFAAESGQFMAFVSYLISSILDRVSPLINQRILYEVDRRILTPYLERDDFGWMGFLGGKRVNNWNPWCNSNCIWAFLLGCTDDAKRAKAMEKAIDSLDFFIDTYHEDGACDEGPRYWNRAGAALVDCLEAFDAATDGAVCIFDRPLIGEMGRFIARTRIDGRYYMNFADSSAVCSQEPATVYRFGKAVGDENLMAEGAYIQSLMEQPIAYTAWYGMNRVMNHIVLYDELICFDKMPQCEKNVWFDGIQVLIAREVEAYGEGLFLAVKGGHNNESHNHNDIGNFIIYDNGKPLVIDVGVGDYTAKTFGPDRYDIWTMRSSGHNLPTIGGYEQCPGEEYAAGEVSCHISEEHSSLELELAGAYPEEAGILTWRRRVGLNRADGSIKVSEAFCFQEPKSIQLVWMTHDEPKAVQDGVLIGGRKLSVSGMDFRITWEFIPTEDRVLRESWGDGVYKIAFDAQDNTASGEVEFVLE